jgi:hypothetical protein
MSYGSLTPWAWDAGLSSKMVTERRTVVTGPDWPEGLEKE